MNSQMKQAEKELYNGNAEETHKQNSSEQLTEREEIEGTPFTIVKNENEWYILMGKYRLSEGYVNKEIAIIEAKHWNWDRIMQVIGVMIKEFK